MIEFIKKYSLISILLLAFISHIIACITFNPYVFLATISLLWLYIILNGYDIKKIDVNKEELK